MDTMIPTDPLPGHRLKLENIRRAASLIDPVFLNAPQFDCEPLSEALACRLTLKLETANPIRSFKGRGAGYLIASRAADGRLSGAAGVAAIAAHPDRFRGRRVATILCGSNLTEEQVKTWLD